ncbi:uncharacterized protein LAESUDRAFT_666499, partial [Laetiporus sulphureus 93-53]
SSYSNENAHSDREDIDYQRVPRRTPMACQFCRARKLKCDGRQTCANCIRRGLICSYVPVYVHIRLATVNEP